MVTHLQDWNYTLLTVWGHFPSGEEFFPADHDIIRLITRKSGLFSSLGITPPSLQIVIPGTYQVPTIPRFGIW